MAVYELTFYCTCCCFQSVFITNFKISGWFSKTANFQTGIEISSPQKFKLFFIEFLVWWIQRSHANLNLVKKKEKIFHDSVIPKIMILQFVSPKFAHDWQVNSICCKSSPYEQAKEFNDFQFYYVPFKPEKKKKKKKKKQIKIYAFLSHFSIFKIAWDNKFSLNDLFSQTTEKI